MVILAAVGSNPELAVFTDQFERFVTIDAQDFTGVQHESGIGLHVVCSVSMGLMYGMQERLKSDLFFRFTLVFLT